jgi:hypothetical protein
VTITNPEEEGRSMNTLDPPDRSGQEIPGAPLPLDDSLGVEEQRIRVMTFVPGAPLAVENVGLVDRYIKVATSPDHLLVAGEQVAIDDAGALTAREHLAQVITGACPTNRAEYARFVVRVLVVVLDDDDDDEREALVSAAAQTFHRGIDEVGRDLDDAFMGLQAKAPADAARWWALMTRSRRGEAR